MSKLNANDNDLNLTHVERDLKARGEIESYFKDKLGCDKLENIFYFVSILIMNIVVRMIRF